MQSATNPTKEAMTSQTVKPVVFAYYYFYWGV
jgi:hypothetical protein